MIVIGKRVKVDDHIRLIEFQAVVSSPKVTALVDEVGYHAVHLVTVLRRRKFEAIAPGEFPRDRWLIRATRQENPIGEIESVSEADRMYLARSRASWCRRRWGRRPVRPLGGTHRSPADRRARPVPPSNSIRALITRILCPRVAG